MPPRLEVRGLSAGYGEARVLHGLDFDVQAGEIVTLLGANGAGKTTTLRALTGVLRAGGEVLLDGKDITGLAPHAVARLGVAHVPDGRGTFTELSVEDNLEAGAWTLRPRRDAAALRQRMYALFPRLAQRRSQAAGTLSGGEQQMLAIARALMMRPRLLLLDEPSFGVAPLVVGEIFEQLAMLNREEGTSILLVEQNASLALEVSRRAVLLETGRIARRGRSEELLADASLREAYFGQAVAQEGAV